MSPSSQSNSLLVGWELPKPTSILFCLTLLFAVACGGESDNPPKDVDDGDATDIPNDPGPDPTDEGGDKVQPPDLGKDFGEQPPPEQAWDVVNLSANEDVNDMWGGGDGRFYAVGNHGTMLWYNGYTWTPLPHLTDADLYGVSGIPGGDVYVVGANGTLLRKDTAGWNILTTGVTEDLYDVAIEAHNSVYLVGEAGTILRFNGLEFSTELSNTKADLYAAFMPPGGIPYAAGKGGQFFKRSGGQWVSVPAASGIDIRDIWGTSANFMVAVGTDGTILLFGGVKWAKQTSNDIKARDLHAVWGTSKDNLYCVGDEGVVIHYNGKKWTQMSTEGPLNTTTAMYALWGSTVGEEVTAFAVGAGGAMLDYADALWRDHRSGPDVAIKDVSSASGIDFMAVGEKGLLMRWSATKGWTGLPSGISTDLHGVYGKGSDYWAVGADGIAITVDQDNRIESQDTGTSKTLNDIAGHEDTVLAVGNSGKILRLEEGNFVSEQSGTIAHLHGVTVSADGAWAVGDNGVLMSRGNDGKWTSQVVPTSNNLRAVGANKQEIWAVGDHGVVLYNDGTDWSKENESPGDFLYGVFSVGNLTLAVGWQGLVLRREEGIWIEEDSGTLNVLEAIAGQAGNAVWVVGRNGTALRRR
jgi:hypothetical protein